jgi:TolB-like protein
VIHRDIKPENILLSGGHATVSDFGIAHAVDAAGGSRLTATGLAIGTPAYMSPEQASGGRAVDARSDVYSLACVAYEMLGGDPPFTGASPQAVMARHAMDRPLPLRSVRPTVSDAVDEVLQRGLAKIPADRFASPTQLAEALEHARVTGDSQHSRARWSHRSRRRRWLVAAAALLGIGAVLVGFNVGRSRDRLVRSAFEPAHIRLAVLPFENLTGDPDQEYFSDGLTEDMITQLGRLEPARLSVIARTSSMRYKKSDKPIDQIGRELGVDFVLEGSARQENGRVKINATLVDVSDQSQRWSDSYERELASILAVQGEIARGIARSLSLALLPAAQSRLANAHVVNPEAYEAYLKGLYHMSKLASANRDSAQRYFEIALRKDPNYALAYMGINRVWAYRDQFHLASREEARSKADAALTQSLLLDNTSAEAHLALAIKLAWWDWEFARAEPEFRRTLELDPNLAEAHAIYADYLIFMKRPSEASAEIQRAVQLDPLNAMVRAFSGRILLFTRKYDEAIAQCREALKTDPNSPIAHGVIEQALYQKRMYKEALASERSRQAALGRSDVVAALDTGFAEGGFAGAMRRAAETVASRSKTSGTTSVAVATFYLRAGDKERALEWLERSYVARDNAMPYISIAPVYDVLRGDPRFQSLLRRMHLPM